VVLSVLNARYISTLFENSTHFSHLADVEREISYRTEMGLYEKEKRKEDKNEMGNNAICEPENGGTPNSDSSSRTVQCREYLTTCDSHMRE
ncbi:hypothetical protein TELCIR_14674, partial [Teladorsagia circumcincta]